MVDGLCGAILDGRDIGTVVCPDADVKFFVIADVSVRARRRLAQTQSPENESSFARIRSDLESRDRADAERVVAPLRAAVDAVLLDTTELTIDAAVKTAIEAIDAKLVQGRR